MKEKKHAGKLIIAGAGPGDPELVTMKTVRYLQQADVILTDRLVSPEILELYANPRAEIVYVGKQCRRGASTPQETINHLMVQYAKSSRLIVRLKGGDVSVFSNVLDELQALTENEIPYEIIPGITAATGAAAYTGIPLTARGYSNAVRFLTYYKSDVLTDEYWKELAVTDDTLVFYMSSETLEKIIANLVKNHIPDDKLIAVVEQATTPFQQVYVSSFGDYDVRLKEKEFISPSLVIIGKVVALHEQFAWLPGNSITGNYFESLSASIKNLITKESAYVGRA